MLTVFFDETCGICMRTKAFLEKIKNDDCEFSTASKMNSRCLILRRFVLNQGQPLLALFVLFSAFLPRPKEF